MLRFVRSWSAISRSLPQFAPARRPHARRRPSLERLEDRTVLSTISLPVTTLLDDPTVPIPGQTTLRDAINTADGGATTNQYVITFKQGLTGTIDLTTSALPDLHNNIVIKGPGAKNLTVQRDSSAPDFSVFTVDKGETVHISGITISGGNAGVGNGGGINNSGALIVSDSTFTGNFAESGIIIVGYNRMTIDGVGGGIENTGILTVNNSAFADNSAVTGGGGICNSGGTLTVNSSIFSNNFAGDGGGIYSAGSFGSSGGIENYGTMMVNDSIFRNNSSAAGGGISNEYASTAMVANSTFTGNSANNSVTGVGYGGGLYNFGTLTVSGSIFNGNSAYAGGGFRNDGTMTVNYSTITNNSAVSFAGNPSYGAASYGGSGGGIYNDGTLTVNYSAITHNSATGSGGGISNDGTLTVINSTIANNSTTGSGGGIYNVEATLVVIESILIDNSANDNGGGIYNYVYGTLTVKDSIFAFNSATDGGGIYSAGTLIDTGNLFFDNTGGDIYP